MTRYKIRKAITSEIPHVWGIIQQAIQKRNKEGSNQWQDGYPNPRVLQNDIEKEEGFVLLKENTIVGYCAIIINNEPAYFNIKGNWLTNDNFVVFHRLAISRKEIGKGLSLKILQFVENFAISNSIYSIKADTNFDNIGMINVFEKTGYIYCGEVCFRESSRRAYEKTLSNL